jgi:hypothetical protein
MDLKQNQFGKQTLAEPKRGWRAEIAPPIPQMIFCQTQGQAKAKAKAQAWVVL